MVNWSLARAFAGYCIAQLKSLAFYSGFESLRLCKHCSFYCPGDFLRHIAVSQVGVKRLEKEYSNLLGSKYNQNRIFWSLSAMILPVLFGFLAFQSEGTCSTDDPMRGFIGATKPGMAMVVLNTHVVGPVRNEPEDKGDHHFGRVQKNGLLYYITFRRFVVHSVVSAAFLLAIFLQPSHHRFPHQMRFTLDSERPEFIPQIKDPITINIVVDFPHYEVDSYSNRLSDTSQQIDSRD